MKTHHVASAIDRQQQAAVRVAVTEAKRERKRAAELLEREAWETLVVERFTNEAKAAMQDSWKPVIKPPVKNDGLRGQPEAACLFISDSHVGKIVEPEDTMGFGEYNPTIFLKRLWHLQNTVARLITTEINRPIDRLHVFFLGDIVDGMLDHGAELPKRELAVDQVLLASLAFFQFLGNLSRVKPLSVYWAAVGNHGRWPNQKKMPTDNRVSNLDTIVAGCCDALLRTLPDGRVESTLNRSPFLVTDVNGWRLHVGHGDHLRGGDKAIGVPSHAIGRQVNAVTQRYAARGEKVPDFYIVGDKHRPLTVPTATGRFQVNGAWFDADSYAMVSNFPPARPHQILFGLHPRIGKTWSFDVALDLAKDQHEYTFPEHVKV